MTVRVAIADDQSLVRDGFRVQLGLAGDMEFAGEASTGEQAVALARRERPDVLLMDVRMPVLDGIEATRRITADPRTAGVRVLVLTTFDIDQYVFAALRAGASGFLLKDATPEELLAAIRIVAAGQALLAPAATRHLVAEFVSRPAVGRPDARLAGELTEREREVLVLIAQGLSNAEIAGRLVVSPAAMQASNGIPAIRRNDGKSASCPVTVGLLCGSRSPGGGPATVSVPGCEAAVSHLADPSAVSLLTSGYPRRPPPCAPSIALGSGRPQCAR